MKTQPTLFDYMTVQPPLNEQYANYDEYKISRNFLYLKNNGYLKNLNNRAEIAEIMSNDEELRKSCSIMTFAYNNTYVPKNPYPVTKCEVRELYSYIKNLVFLSFAEKLRNVENMSERDFLNKFDRRGYYRIGEKLTQCYSYGVQPDWSAKRKSENKEIAMKKLSKFKEEFETINIKEEV